MACATTWRVNVLRLPKKNPHSQKRPEKRLRSSLSPKKNPEKPQLRIVSALSSRRSEIALRASSSPKTISKPIPMCRARLTPFCPRLSTTSWRSNNRWKTVSIKSRKVTTRVANLTAIAVPGQESPAIVVASLLRGPRKKVNRACFRKPNRCESENSIWGGNNSDCLLTLTPPCKGMRQVWVSSKE